MGLRSGIDIRPASGLQCIQFLPFFNQVNCGLVFISPRSRTVLNASIPDTRSAADKKVHTPGISAVIIPNGSRFQDSCTFAISYLGFSSLYRPSACQPVLYGPIPLRTAERRSVPIPRPPTFDLTLTAVVEGGASRSDSWMLSFSIGPTSMCGWLICSV